MPEKENNAEKKLEEANFNVSSLSEVKDANGNGIFHMRTKTKFILVISILILLSAGALIYLFIEKYIEAEIWQAAIWGLCAILAVYSMFAKSILAMLLNLILFAGVSFLPVWQTGHETLRPIIEKFSEDISQPIEETETAPAAPPAESQKVEESKIEKSEPVEEEEKSSSTKAVQENNSVEETQPAQENNFRQDLPSI